MRQFFAVLFGLFAVCVTCSVFGQAAIADDASSVSVMKDTSVRSSKLLPMKRVHDAQPAFWLAGGFKHQNNRQRALLPVVGHVSSEHVEAASETQSMHKNEPTKASVSANENEIIRRTVVVEGIDGEEVILETIAGRIRIPLDVLPEVARHEGAILVLEHRPLDEEQRRDAARSRVERMKRMSNDTIEI